MQRFFREGEPLRVGMGPTTDISKTSQSNTNMSKNGFVVSVSEKGQATIPKELREKHGIDAPGKVRIRENQDGDVVVEPVGGLTEMRGAASDDWAGTDLLAEERERDRARDERLRRDEQ